MAELSDTHITESRSIDDIANAPDRKEPIGFILRLTKALHTYGLPAYELEQTMNGCAEALGYGIQCMSTPTSISITIFPPDDESKTFLIRVSPGEVNLERLRQTTNVALKVINGEINTKQGADYLKQISSNPPDYSRFIIVLAFSLVSASISRIFSGGFNEILASAIIGSLVGIIAINSKNHPLVDHFMATICAFFATFTSLSIKHFTGIDLETSVVVISGLIILLPGLSLTIAFAELATQNLVSGTARIAGTITIFVQLAFGSILAGELIKVLQFEPSSTILQPVELWSIWVAVAVAAIALVPLFAARIKDVGWFLLASLSAFTTLYFSSQSLGPALGAFTGAITIGFMARISTHFFNIPGAMIMMPGFIILVPGTVGYKSILALVEHDAATTLSTAIDMATIGLSLVAGFLMSSLVLLPKNNASDQY